MLLEVNAIHKAYGSTPVIRGLDLQVATGEFVGVIGPNGAGKTTAFGLIAGHLRCDSGTVRLAGRDITRLSADQRCRAGIGRTFQIPQPFGGMTVYENTLVAATYGAGLRGKVAQQAARDALELCGLLALGDAPGASLRLLQRKRLEVARSLATGPQLLLLDEVGGGLTDAEVHELLALVQAVHARGVTVLWIEHLVHALVSVVRRLVVLTEGRVLADGPPNEVIASREVRESYLGSELDMEAEVAGAAH
ncbi:ABC transporter ATP-binding protein [Piscinibacter sp.]|uniref:ABC transporter ATP-binding protein n=1 Tax=Piscinibacter sp. TaxID=1903157 RepID=UPI002C6CA222|nr:ATP-binding cassette domain-containing protein [Albitalea sp.]HUG26070.1 ATP-binding cassette domain-containing protein [Albitalea sp.]